MATRKIRVGKVDLDTCGAAYLLGVTREDEVVVVRGNAAPEDLANAETICIEVGGSGEVAQNNWDHHTVDGPNDSATMQVLNYLYWSNRFDSGSAYYWIDCQSMLADYINLLDTEGPEALRAQTGGIEFPTLSDVFAGMLLTERDPVEQLHKGIEILQEVARTHQDVFGTICGFDSYAEAKAVNNAAIAKAVEKAQWTTTTQGGRKLAFLETDFFGAPGALYGAGAEIAVAYAPQFGAPPVPKFTIAGNGVKVDSVLSALNALEEGWGGPPTGTIIGSPRTGSTLSLEQVVEIVKNNL